MVVDKVHNGYPSYDLLAQAVNPPVRPGTPPAQPATPPAQPIIAPPVRPATPPAPAIPAGTNAASFLLPSPSVTFGVSGTAPVAPVCANSEENLRLLNALKISTGLILTDHAIYTSVYSYTVAPREDDGLNAPKSDAVNYQRGFERGLNELRTRSEKLFEKYNTIGKMKTVQKPFLDAVIEGLLVSDAHLYDALNGLISDNALPATVQSDLRNSLGRNLDELNEIEMMRKVKAYHSSATDEPQKQILMSIAMAVDAVLTNHAIYTSVYSYTVAPREDDGLNAPKSDAVNYQRGFERGLNELRARSEKLFEKYNTIGKMKTVQKPFLDAVIEGLLVPDVKLYQAILNLYYRLPVDQKTLLQPYLGSGLNVNSFDEIGFLRALNGIAGTIQVQPEPVVASITPNSGNRGTALSVGIGGTGTHFIRGATTVSFGNNDVRVSNIDVQNETHLICDVAIDANAAMGARNVVVTTGCEVVTQADAFTVNVAAPAPTASAAPVKPATIQAEAKLTPQITNNKKWEVTLGEISVSCPRYPYAEVQLNVGPNSSGGKLGVKTPALLGSHLRLEAAYGMKRELNITDMDDDNPLSLQTLNGAMGVDMTKWVSGYVNGSLYWRHDNGFKRNLFDWNAGLKFNFQPWQNFGLAADLGVGQADVAPSLSGEGNKPLFLDSKVRVEPKEKGFYLAAGGRVILNNDTPSSYTYTLTEPYQNYLSLEGGYKGFGKDVLNAIGGRIIVGKKTYGGGIILYLKANNKGDQ